MVDTLNVDVRDQLNRALPAAHRGHLGDVLFDLVTAFNALRADHAALLAKYNAFLGHADAGALGTSNVTTYGAPVATSVAVLAPDARG